MAFVLFGKLCLMIYICVHSFVVGFFFFLISFDMWCSILPLKLRTLLVITNLNNDHLKIQVYREDVKIINGGMAKVWWMIFLLKVCLLEWSWMEKCMDPAIESCSCLVVSCTVKMHLPLFDPWACLFQRQESTHI